MSIKGDDARTNVYGQLSVNPLAADSGVNHGVNLWHPGDRRFGMFMSTPGKGKGLGGGDVPDGGIAAHSVRFTTGNNPAHGFVFQNSDGKALMSIKGDDGRLNTYGDLNANGNVRLNGTVTAPNGHTIHNDGRQHISAGEILYLLPKSGVQIGREWGGTGSLNVQGDLSVGGKNNLTSGGWAVGNGFMAPGSLTIGDINQNYGNGNNWNKSTAGLLMECADKTEIAVHDAGTRVASLMQYDGPTNQITLGRDMAWGPTGGINMAGPVNIQGKWRLGDTGDDWLRINAPGRSDGNGYYGGVAAGRLWTANGGVVTGSDSRMKDNVIDIDKVNADNILKLNPKAYTYKDDKDKRQRFGFIAQDVEKVYPNMVTNGPNGFKSMNYDDIIPLTVANIKDIRKSIPDNKSLCIDGVCLNKNDLINLKKLSSL